MSFVHLQCHTEYSLSEGIIKIHDMLNVAKQDEMQACAITDLNNLFAMVKFYQAAYKYGIKPIIGSEVHIIEDGKKTNLILLCKDKVGYKNLTNIISWVYGVGRELTNDHSPAVSLEILRLYNTGLIAITPMHNGYGQEALLRGKSSHITQLDFLQKLFPNSLYLGLSRINKKNEERDIYEVCKYACENNLPVVALNNVCFTQEEDFFAHEARTCINNSTTLDDKNRPRLYTSKQYFKSTAQMKRLFADIPSAIENTNIIATRCNLTLELFQVFLPNYPVPKDSTTDSYLIDVARKGLENRFNGKVSPEYNERLEIELGVINKMGFAGYFLIVADFIQWAKNNDVPVGPGRGSGAGSLVAYVLGITDLDPLMYDLLFERFLNPERVSMPDFDIDFCMDGRDRVIDYVGRKYGQDAVSQIITYGTMAAKAVCRDVGRVLGYPYGFVDKIAKLIPMEIGMTLDKALKDEEELIKRYREDEDVKNLIDLARKLEGITRNVGKHAGGVVIAPSKITDFTPIYRESVDSQIVSQFDKNDVETIGLVKFDFLGLRTLTIIDWAIKSLKENDITVEIDKIPLDCQKTFEMLCDTKTTAVFQLESRGMKDLIKRLQPDCFEDIVALVALFRPGPLQSGMVDDFINRKKGLSKIEYPHPDLEPILRPTYGVILYQEQVMQIAQVLAGYTLGSADMLRRAMGKKKPEEMAKQRTIFTDGATALGVDSKVATYIFDLMEKFAGYGFNKSHSAAYALVSYQTAWLKAHYTSHFMSAVLSADMNNTDKIVMLIDDCRDLGLRVVLPNINYSDYKFKVDEKNRINYGLGAIKGVGEGAIESIITERKKNGKFSDVFNLCTRANLKAGKRTLEALVKSGALDDFGTHRGALLGMLPDALQAASQVHKNNQSGQIDIFGNTVTIENLGNKVDESIFPKLKKLTRLAHEKETLGLYLTGHPLDLYKSEFSKIISNKIKNLRPGGKKQIECIAGMIISMRVMQTKRGDKMAFIAVDDQSGRQDIAIFSDLYRENFEVLRNGEIIIIEGNVQKDNFTGGNKMRATKIQKLSDYRREFATGVKLEMDSIDTSQLSNIIERYPGNTKVFIQLQRNAGTIVLELPEEYNVELTNNFLEDSSSLTTDNANSSTVLYNKY